MSIQLQALSIETVRIPLLGTSGLIMHAWSEKAKKLMRDKQMKKAAKGRDAKDPEQDVIECFYPPASDGSSLFGFPSVAFKAALVSSARVLASLKMTELRAALHVLGEYSPIYGAWTPREDMVRVGMGTADIRYRPEFKEWGTVLTVRYNADFLSEEMVVNLFQSAGFSCGVGEWRPEKDGAFGMFTVCNEPELAAVIKATPTARPEKA